LHSASAKLDLETRKLCIENRSDFNHPSAERKPGGARRTNDRPKLTVFSTPNGRGEKRACWIGLKERKDLAGHRESTTSHPVKLRDAKAWAVKPTETIKIPPRVKQTIVGRVAMPKRQTPPKLVCVEPAQLPYEGILAARGLSPLLSKEARSGTTPNTSPCLSAEQSTTLSRAEYVHIMLVSFS
jgi:hypothetical protein